MTDKPVLFIDLLNLFCRSFSSLPLTNDDGLHVGGVFGSLNALQSYIKRFQPSECIIAWEGLNSGERRRKKLREYKEGRKFTSMKRGFETSDGDEKEAFARQLELLRIAMDQLPMKQVAVKYLEADDAIAYLARKVIKQKSIIVTTDKDYLQLIDENISVFRPVKTKENPQGELIDLEWMYSKENIHPYNYALLKAIVGDKSDNIAGIRGVGEKTARKEIHLLWAKENFDIDDLFDWLRSRKEDKYQKYLDNEDLIRLNYKVVQLLELEISLIAIDSLQNSYISDTPKFNSYQFRLKLMSEDINPTNIDGWLANFSILNTNPVV